MGLGQYSVQVNVVSNQIGITRFAVVFVLFFFQNEKSLRDTMSVIQFRPSSRTPSTRPGLGPNCLQRLSAGDPEPFFLISAI